ncbi:unnamed protein product [Pleuronectes platessa]|uniref:Uncharacterized protein n=1 Tax=Pleuronectes platessa TaxID=8262 RepID=A0A9N7YAC5_PLEPL|nr:unnamed protein product [Pleuronectes platessa]
MQRFTSAPGGVKRLSTCWMRPDLHFEGEAPASGEHQACEERSSGTRRERVFCLKLAQIHNLPLSLFLIPQQPETATLLKSRRAAAAWRSDGERRGRTRGQGDRWVQSWKDMMEGLEEMMRG